MYKYASKKEISDTRQYTERIINSLRESLKEKELTFSSLLVGSRKRKLVTKNIEKNSFDLDYQLIFKKTLNKNININKNIKEDIFNILSDVTSAASQVNDSTSSIHYFTTNNKGNIIIESDIAIFIEEENKKFHIKGQDGDYQKVELNYSKILFEKFNQLTHNEFITFQEKYLNIKNTDAHTNNFHILLDLLQEI